MNRIRVYGLTCVLMLVAAAAANATTIVVPTDEQLIAKSPVILTGTVESTGVLDDEDGRIWTQTSIKVASVLKGSAEPNILVREMGGQLPDRFTVVYGTPQFTSGERVLLFLEPNPHGGYRVMDMFVGKMREARQLDGRRLWTRDDAAARVTLLDADFQPLEAKNVQRDAVAFETFIRERIAGRDGAKNYGVQNPVLAPATPRGSAYEQFTLLSEGRVYRWFAFDNGGSAQWYSIGSQTGYSGGGVNETRTGMNAWNNYSGAKINYAYAGTRPTATGGVNRPNGYNEVFFNDPLNEISGSYNSSTGGVVGLGGYNGVGSGGNWNAPFTADSSHPAGTQRAYEITEANLTIQDGVTASAGISSTRLAEIIAHEFGHTLGFGHSAENNALMYASVTGLGPSLRNDDQLAARWLYPNGSGGGGDDPAPSAPAAPTNLAATPSGTNVNVSWTDNSNNETGFHVYVAAGTGSYTHIGDVGANVRAATLTGFTAGSYRIYITAYNGAGASSNSNVAQVTITGTSTGLTARFSFTPQSGSPGTTFSFVDESTGGATSRQWNFGDGTTSTAANPNKVYNNAGAYTVTLTVFNATTSSQAQNTVIVNAALTPNFTWSPAAPTTNDSVQFSDQSTGGITGWAWNFGDGTSSTAQNPSKRFTVPGTYSVSLTVSRNGESKATTKNVIVASPAPIVPPITGAFDVSASTAVAGSNITFNDKSTGAPTAWSWAFGDGTYSSLRNPVHAYAAPGTYTVTLIASNVHTSGTAQKTITVTAMEPYRSLVSAAAHTNGLGGTAWRTELILFNAGTNGANVTLLFIPGAGGSLITRSLFLSPKQLATYANTLVDLFGVTNGAGAVAIEATSAGAAAQLRITSRTFTGATAGTYGLSVPDVQSEALAQTLYATGIRSDDAFRTNIGLVNRGGTDVGTTLTLYDANGAIVSTENVTVPANNFQQLPLSMVFPEIEGRELDVLSMRVQAQSQNAVTAYVSVVDNRTQDPVYMQAMPAVSGTTVTVPIVGRASGANGTFWRSDVTIFNQTGARLVYTIRYNGTSRTLALDARSTFVLEDIVTQMGHANGIGTLSVSGNTAPVVTTRNYTTGGGGSFGQSIDPVRAFNSELFVAGLRSDANYRSNLGFVNGGNEPESFTITLYSEWGSVLASTEWSLDPNQVIQQSVGSLFPGVSLGGNFTVHVRGDANAKLFAYGSMIDNLSGDPVFVAGR